MNFLFVSKSVKVILMKSTGEKIEGKKLDIKFYNITGSPSYLGMQLCCIQFVAFAEYWRALSVTLTLFAQKSLICLVFSQSPSLANTVQYLTPLFVISFGLSRACFWEWRRLLLKDYWDSCFWPLGPVWPFEYSYLYQEDCSFSSQRIIHLKIKPPIYSKIFPPLWKCDRTYKVFLDTLFGVYVLRTNHPGHLVPGLMQMHLNSSHT